MNIADALALADEYEKQGCISRSAQAVVALADYVRNIESLYLKDGENDVLRNGTL